MSRDKRRLAGDKRLLAGDKRPLAGDWRLLAGDSSTALIYSIAHWIIIYLIHMYTVTLWKDCNV